MERWDILAAPSEDDPQRHLLLISGGMSDVAAILKKFGALCGRPMPLDGEDFNMSFALHRLTPAVRKKLEHWLCKMAPPPPPAPPEEAVAPAAEEVPSFKLAEPPPPAPEIAATRDAFALPPVAAPPAPPAPVVSAVAAAPTARTAPITRAPSTPAPLTLSEPMRRDWNFENLLVGAYNRFAHAAAMSVVASPGSMYNPLFLYGMPGTGKSHLMQAIAAALSKGLGDSSILITSGARLSRMVSVCLERGSTAEIDKKVADSTAIFVDDIHLMAVTEKNKEALAQVFKAFFERNQQVVLTSLYPPRALGALEEALKFSFSKGWSVDLKIPSPGVQKELITAVCDRLAVQFSSEDVGRLHDKLSVWGYQDLTLWVQRLADLRLLNEKTGQANGLADMLKLIYAPISAGIADLAETKAAASFSPPVAGPEAEPVAVIVPQGQDWLGAYAAAMFYEVGSRSGIKRSYRHALWQSYDSMQQVGLPFEIADMCLKAGVTRALIVGPGPDSPLAPRAGEFGHAVRRILDSIGVRVGWIPYSGLRIGAHYLNAHLDFEAAPRADTA